MSRPKCPYCGGPANSMELIQAFSSTQKLVYAVECWSGSPNVTSRRHHFTATIYVRKGQVEIDQLKEAEEEIKALEAELRSVKERKHE